MFDLYKKKEIQFSLLFWRIFTWLEFLHFLPRSSAFLREEKRRRFAACTRRECVAVCFYMCVCARVGLRQNRAAEMRQALQIFVGWLTAPCLCQAPTAETTKRRIRLALEPQIFSPPSIPPSLFSFSFLAPWRGVYFGRGLTRIGNIHTHPRIYQSVFISLWSDRRGGVENMAPETPREVLGRLPRWCVLFFFFFGHHLVLCCSLTPPSSFHKCRRMRISGGFDSFQGFCFPFHICRLCLGDFRATLPQKTTGTIASGVTSMRHWAHVPPKT